MNIQVSKIKYIKVRGTQYVEYTVSLGDGNHFRSAGTHLEQWNSALGSDRVELSPCGEKVTWRDILHHKSQRAVSYSSAELAFIFQDVVGGP